MLKTKNEINWKSRRADEGDKDTLSDQYLVHYIDGVNKTLMDGIEVSILSPSYVSRAKSLSFISRCNGRPQKSINLLNQGLRGPRR